ncbi:MAG: DUF805 domain-containing protein [Desulfobulbaceae bacterium]|jgi:uncharacterized membrane protein YhaH (DUF805 family)|nr:DUF805 domain-containing protein [Desulfobulbaceae bacterium]
MQWFIKCLRQYADFSGRARRKEYWMFTLWQTIFYLVAILAAALVLFLVIPSADHNEFIGSSYGPTLYAAHVIEGIVAVGWCYNAAMLLPGLAVTVRRLHDVGQSAWTLLVALLPIVGPIWLLILMMTNGQQGENFYGPDPKTLPQPFATSAPLTNAGGIMLIIAGSVLVLIEIVSLSRFFLLVLLPPIGWEEMWLLWLSVRMASSLLLLATGVCLLRRKVTSAFVSLLITASIRFILYAVNVWNSIQGIHDWIAGVGHLTLTWFWFLPSVFGAASWLTLALFAAFVLWRRTAARQAAVAVMVLSGLWLLSYIPFNMEVIDRLLQISNSRLFDLLSLLNVFPPIALIVLAIESIARWKTAIGEELTERPI